MPDSGTSLVAFIAREAGTDMIQADSGAHGIEHFDTWSDDVTRAHGNLLPNDCYAGGGSLMLTQRYAVGLYRVSTAEQGHSGLGLEAQQAANEAWLMLS